MIRGVLLDLSGVLYQGDRSLPGARDAIGRLDAAGVPIRLLTNTTSTTREGLADKLGRMGFDIPSDVILTPAAAARDALLSAGLTPHLLTVPELAVEFDHLPDTGAPAVVVGDAGRGFTYEALNHAFRLLMQGAPLYALATNRMYRDDVGNLNLDAGPFVRALEHAADVEARLFGKPSPIFFEAGAAALGCDLSDVAMVGDDAEADVSSALKARIGTAILVRSGKYRDGDADRVDPAPSSVTDTLADAVETIMSEAG